MFLVIQYRYVVGYIGDDTRPKVRFVVKTVVYTPSKKGAVGQQVGTLWLTHRMLS